MSRIRLDMTMRDVVVEMCDGNPGGLNILLALVAQAPGIDPDAALGSMAPLFVLDELGIYGPSIWMLYKDVCGQNLPKMLACLRAFQLGLAGITREKLAHAIENRGEGIDPEAALAAVRERLPRFAAPAAEVTP